MATGTLDNVHLDTEVFTEIGNSLAFCVLWYLLNGYKLGIFQGNEEGWFECSHLVLQKELGVSYRPIHRALRRLESKGFIETKRAFRPGQQSGPLKWIRLNLKGIYRHRTTGK